MIRYNPPIFPFSVFLFILFYTVFFSLPAGVKAETGPFLQKTAVGSEGNDVIRSIKVEGLKTIKDSELVSLIGLKAGDRLDKNILRDGIKRAFLKGIFLDIAVDEEHQMNGIRLTYIVRERDFIRDIKIRGNHILSGGKIRDAFIFKEGDEFRDDLLKDAADKIRELYEERGIPGTAVSIDVKEAALYRVDLIINITEGRPEIIDDIVITGEYGKGIDASEIKDIMRLSAGDRLDRLRIEKDIGRITNYLERKGYFKAEVGPYRYEEGKLIIPVESGPRLKLSFAGNKVFSTEMLEKEMPFKEEKVVNKENIEEASRRILRLYRARGYYFAQVSVDNLTTKDEISITFHINEGHKVIVKQIVFSDTSISDKALRGIMTLKEGGPFNEGIINSDAKSITEFYNALGYLDAKVTDTSFNLSDDLRYAFVHITVSEGKQTKIGDIRIEGNNVISEDKIMKAINLHKGDIYNEVDIGDARYKILGLYNSLGYINCQVGIESQMKGQTADLSFKITEGPQSFFGKVIIRGNRETKERVIRRELEIREGEPYNYALLLKARQRLYSLGIFSEVAIDTIKGSGNEKDILVTVKEGKPGIVEFGFGYGDYDKYRGFIGVTYRNLFGRNLQLGFRAEGSSVERRFSLNFKDPWLFERRLPLTLSLSDEYRKSLRANTREIDYEIKKYSFFSGIDKSFNDNLKGSLSYEYASVNTFNVKPGVILTRQDTGTLGIGSINPSVILDTRDNPFNPTAGSLNGIIAKFASKAFISETEFIKVVLQSSWYRSIRRGLVLALSLRAGFAEGFGNTRELPLVERFFLGGRTTVRGYAQDTLGPKGADGTPTGGDAFALINAELRISLGRGFALVTFLDGGNVWIKSSEFAPGDLRYTTGVGLRYNTPVGPISIDYGHKLQRQPGESPGELQFSIGQAF